MKKLTAVLVAVAMVLTMTIPAFAEGTTLIVQNGNFLTAKEVREIKPEANAASANYTKIKVSWGSIDGVDGYEIVRAVKKSGKYVKIYTSSDVEKNSYINANRITGRKYFYKIRGYKKIAGKKVYTKYSNIVSAFSRPSKVKITVSLGNESADGKGPYDNVPKINWSKVAGATGYEVYRTIEGKNRYKKIATTTATTFRDGYKRKNGYSSYKNYEYKVRAYRVVNGKKIYGVFSESNHYVPDWTIDELMQELIAYGESIKGKRLLYSAESGELVPYDGIEGENYTLKHIVGYIIDESAENEYIPVKWGDIEAIQHPGFVKNTPENTSWTALFPEYIGHYWSKDTVLKQCKENIRFAIEDEMKENPLVYEPADEFAEEGWTGTVYFTLYLKKSNNGYAFWVMH